MEGVPLVNMMSLEIEIDGLPAVVDDVVRTSPNPVKPSVAPDTTPASQSAKDVSMSALEMFELHKNDLFRETEPAGQWVCVVCRPDALMKTLAPVTNKTAGFCGSIHAKLNHGLAHKKWAAAQQVRAENAEPSAPVATRPPSCTAARACGKENYELWKRMMVETMTPFNAVETPTTVKILSALGVGTVSRKKIRDDIVDDSNKLRREIINYICDLGGCVIVMIDAGTVLRRSFVNINVATVSPKPLVVFWRAFEPKAQLKQEMVRKLVAAVLTELRAAGVKVVGCVADNASNMQNAINNDRLMIENGATVLLTPEEAGEDDRVIDEVEELEDHPAAVEAPIRQFFENNEQLEKLVADGRVKKGGFFFAIRCWAHTFQLILHDAVALPAVRQVFDLLDVLAKAMSGDRSALKLAMRKFCDEAGKKFLEPPRPCDTRWNSRLVFLKYILENRMMIEASLITTESKATLKHWKDGLKNCCLVSVALNPIGVATDFVQSDKCTLIEAFQVYSKMIDELKKMKNCPWGANSRHLADELNALVDQIIGMASKRKLSNLDNKFAFIIRYFDFMDQRDRNEVVYGEMRNILEHYCADFGVSMDDMSRQFANHHGGTKLEMCPLLHRVVEIARNVLVTEAAVERSFHTMVKIARPERNRMSTTTLDTMLFMKFNRDKWEAHKDQINRKLPTGREKLHEVGTRMFSPDGIVAVVMFANHEYAAKNNSHILSRQAALMEKRVMVGKHSLLFVGFDMEDELRWYRAIAVAPPTADGIVTVQWTDGDDSDDKVDLKKGQWFLATVADSQRPAFLDWHTFTPPFMTSL